MYSVVQWQARVRERDMPPLGPAKMPQRACDTLIFCSSRRRPAAAQKKRTLTLARGALELEILSDGGEAEGSNGPGVACSNDKTC